MRRTRYTINFEDGTKQVVLDYGNHDWAIAKYGDKGIRSITKGDYRKVEAKRTAIREGGFTIDHEAVDGALEALGVRWPVDIRESNHFAFAAGSNGTHKVTKSLNHAVMIKSYLTPEQASFTLWHELTHAMQYEREYDGTYSSLVTLHRTQRQYSYKQRPIEKEANEMAALMKDIPLCY